MSIAAEIRKEAEAKESARRQRGVENYRAMVRTTAAGTKRPSIHDIERTAADASKTIGDFTADVERQEKRIGIAARFQKIPTQRAKLAELRQAIEAQDAVLAEAEAKHAEAVGPLVAGANELASQIEQADALKQQLIATADPEVIAAIDAAGEEHLQADTAVRQARQEIEIARGNGSEQLLERYAGRPGFDSQHHERIVADAKAAAERLPDLEKTLIDAEARYAQARQKLLEP